MNLQRPLKTMHKEQNKEEGIDNRVQYWRKQYLLIIQNDLAVG